MQYKKEEKKTKKDLSNEFLFFCPLSQMWESLSVGILLLVTSAPTNDC